MEVASRNAGPAVLTLGRLGDVTAALPLAHELSYQIGHPVPFIVSKEFAPLLECASYVEPVIYDQPFHKLAGAIRRFQHRYSKLHIAQCYHTDGQMPPPSEDSFVKDAWKRAGMLDKFGLPLVIDRRNPEREKKTTAYIPNDFIVVHRGGISSPYPYRAELLKGLQPLSGNIFDITGMGCERPQDLLAILERASVAILADSFPLHLSYACRDLPVIALQTDKPSNWFGSPPRSNWVANYRYEESLKHMPSILDTAQEHFKKTKQTHFSFPENVYNASVLDHKRSRLFTWRYHPALDWKTKLFGIKDGDKDIVPIRLAGRAIQDELSHEDARLFMHNGKPHLSYSLAQFVGKVPRGVVEYGPLSFGRDEWVVSKQFRVNYGKNDWSAVEKNHVFWSQHGKLYCLYSSEPEQIILEIVGDSVAQVHRSPSPSWAYGPIRGDVVVPYSGNLLRIFHTRVNYPRMRWRYHIGASLMSAEPPFETLDVNPVPLFSGQDAPKKVFHSKAQVVFVCGAVVDGDDLLVTLSKNDHSSELVRLTRKQLGL